MNYYFLLQYVLYVLFFCLYGAAAEEEESHAFPACSCGVCPVEHVSGSISEGTSNPNVPVWGAGVNIAPEPPTAIDWVDLLNPDGSSKGAIPISPGSSITMSAVLVGDANLITANKFHHPAQSSSVITVNVSGMYNFKGNAFYIGNGESVYSDHMVWTDISDTTVTEDNRLTGIPGRPQGFAEYYIENASSFEITIENNIAGTRSQHLTVPSITYDHQSPGPVYTHIWGADGQSQQGEGLVPEFSFAGYKSGYKKPKLPTRLVDVKSYGAKGDGVTDDTQAIRDAIASIDQGGIFFPRGTYVIRDLIDINKSGIHLIGEKREQTTLYFPHNLKEVLGPDLSGPTNPSWSGGFIRFHGVHSQVELAKISQEAERGATRIYVDEVSALAEGTELRFYQNGRQLTSYMAGDEPSANNWIFQQLVQVTKVGADYIDIDRPLRVPIILADVSGRPRLYEFSPTVRGGGIRNLTLAFPHTEYEGHWTEKGYNAVELKAAVDIVIDNVTIHNADSGIFAFPGNMHNEISNVTFTSERVGAAGHHGIVSGNDMLVRDVTFECVYLHDFTVTRGSSGNVFRNSSGPNLNLDFHHGAPYETLFTDSDLGQGSRWLSSSGGGYGYHSGKGTVYWNLRSTEPLNGPPTDHAPPGSLVMAGLNVGLNFGRLKHHLEYIAPEDIRPQNLHDAQLIRRYKDIFIREETATDTQTFVQTSGNILLQDSARLAGCYELKTGTQWQEREFSESLGTWSGWRDVPGEIGDSFVTQNANQSMQYRKSVWLENYPIHMTTKTIDVRKVPCLPDDSPPIGQLHVEAETSLLRGDWVIEQDDGASGGNFVVNWLSNGGLPLDDSSALHYEFTVEEEGEYELWGRTISPNGADNSFWIKVDDGGWIFWDLPHTPHWRWNALFDYNTRAVPSFILRPGCHKVCVSTRENGTKLDSLCLVQRGRAPLGSNVIEDNTAGIVFEAECAALSGDWEERPMSEGDCNTYVVNHVSNLSEPSEQPISLLYDFRVKEEGFYNIWGKLRAPNGANNSFWVSVDGEAWMYWSVYAYSDMFEWRPLYDEWSGHFPSMYLSMGSHQIAIQYRENGTQLDKLYISGINACPPDAERGRPVRCAKHGCTLTHPSGRVAPPGGFDFLGPSSSMPIGLTPTIVWAAVPEADMYNVYIWEDSQGEQDPPSLAFKTSTPEWLTPALNPATGYRFQVHAVNAAGIGVSMFRDVQTATTARLAYVTWAENHGGHSNPNLDNNGNGMPDLMDYFLGARLDQPKLIPMPVLDGTGQLWWNIPYDPEAMASWQIERSGNLSDWETLDLIPNFGHQGPTLRLDLGDVHNQSTSRYLYRLRVNL